MPRRAPLSAMGRLAERIDELARIPSRASSAIAVRLQEKVDEQFEEGKNPYGQPWAALAERTLEKHGEPALQGEFGARPGEMASGTTVTTSRGAGVQFTVPFPGAIHQTGASKGAWKMPKRAILPDRGTLPDVWRAVIAEELSIAYSRK